MPVIMKSSDNGMADPVTKTVRLPGYLSTRPDSSKLARAVAIAVLPLAAITLTSPPANANVVLSNGGVTASINTGGGTGPVGLNSLLINGQQQVQQQWFFFRTGTGGAASSLDTLTAGSPNVTDTGSADILDIKYSGTYAGPQSTSANYSIDVKYTLVGNSPTSASLTELIDIANSSDSTASLPIDLFQYDHFTLNADTSNEVVGISTPAPHNTAKQTEIGTGNSMETVATPTPDFYQTGLFSSLNSSTFTSAGLTNLSDAAGPAGPGDVTWAFEWSQDAITNGLIPPGGDEQISKVRTITVPEPAASGLAVGAAGALAFARPPRRRKTA